MRNVLGMQSLGPLVFSMGTVRNPPSVEPQGSFDVTAMRADGTNMAVCSSVKITGITTDSLGTASFTIDQRQVGTAGIGLLQFTVYNLMAATDTILVQFPAGISLALLT